MTGRGIWSDGTTMWAVNVDEAAATDGVSTVYAFGLGTKQRDPDNDIDLDGQDPRVRFPRGLAGTLDTSGVAELVQVAVGQAQHFRVQGYGKGATGSWEPSSALNVSFEGNTVSGDLLRGVWNSGEILWVVHDDEDSSRLLAYRVDGNGQGTEVIDEHMTLDSDNTEPRGIWSDGETMWVADAAHVYAYDTATKTRAKAKEFNSNALTVKGEGIGPWGIWGDGSTMWLMAADEIIYSFNMPVSNNTDLRQLEVQHAAEPALDVDQRDHSVPVPAGRTSTTLTFAPRNLFADVVATPTDANGTLDGHQVDLTGGPVAVTVTVTAADGVTTGVYTVTVGPAPPEITGVAATPGNGLLVVSWHEPSNSATLGLTAYDLRYAPTDASDLDDDQSWTVIEEVWTTGDSGLLHRLEGLTNDQAYYVQLRGVNALGDGPWIPHSRLSESATATPAVSTALDARLSSITVNGAAIPDLAEDRGTYTAGVASTVVTATVIGTAADTAATVLCVDDSDMVAEGCQASLTPDGSTDVRLTVTSGTNLGNYTITINRGRGGTFRHKASQDIYGLGLALTTSFPRGLWSDGTTMWVVNNGVPKGLLAFNLQTGARDPEKDVLSGSGLAGGQSSVRGLAGHGGVILVADSGSRDITAKVFGYTENSDGRRQHSSSHDLTGPPGEGIVGSNLQGVWTDGEVLWAAHSTGGISAYHLTGPNKNQRLEAEDFPPVPGLKGLWSDGETMWVARSSAINAFDMVTKQAVANKNFSRDDLRIAGQDHSPWGIWSDGETMWAGGTGDIYSFEMPVSDNATLRYFRIDGVNAAGFDRELGTQTLGVPNDASTITIDALPRHFRAQYAITSDDDDANTPGHQIDVSGGAKTFTATVTAQDGDTTKAYSIEIGRLPAQAAVPSVTPGPRSLTVTWNAPSDAGASAVTSYDLRYAEGFGGLFDEDRWTVIEDVWRTGDGALSHTLTNLDPRSEYAVQVRAGNAIGANPWRTHLERGEGTPQPSGSDVSSLSALSITPGTLAPAFAAGTTGYTLELARSTRQVTIAATPTDTDATLAILGAAGGQTLSELADADDQADGFQVDVPTGAYTITARVTAESLVDSTDYTMTVTRVAADTDADLSGLSLGDAALDALLGFATATTSYTFDVSHDVAQITVTPTAASTAATVAFLDGASGTTELADADIGADGFQIDLIGGTRNVFRVQVTAESGAQEGVHAEDHPHPAGGRRGGRGARRQRRQRDPPCRGRLAGLHRVGGGRAALEPRRGLHAHR